MTEPRPNPTIWISWIRKLLVGETACEWSSWFRSHYTKFDKIPSDFTVWKIDHTTFLAELRVELSGEGKTVLIEGQNQFWLKGNDNVELVGTPDLVVLENGSGIIYDAKTGQPCDGDIAQIMIYMWALPYTKPEYKAIPFSGVAAYRTHRVEIPSSAIDEKFKRNLIALIKRIANEMPAIKVPSQNECGFCDLTLVDCPERYNSEHKEAATGITDAF